MTLTDRIWLRQFIEQLGAQGTTVLVGAAEASWTRALVERHGAYVRSMVESLFDKATSVGACQDEDHVPHKDIPESQDDEFARSVRVRDAARHAFIAVDTDQRLRRAAVSASRPDRLTFESRDMCTSGKSWNGHCGVPSWSRPLLR